MINVNCLGLLAVFYAPIVGCVICLNDKCC